MLDWGIALAAWALLSIFLLAAKRVVVHRLSIIAQRTGTPLDDIAADVLSSTSLMFIVIIAGYAGTHFLSLPMAQQSAVFRIAAIAFLIQAALWGDKGIRLWLAHCIKRAETENAASVTSTAVLGFVARMVLWIVIVLMILDNLGFNITTLIASLGIGGIAVALAVQNILGDIFASLSIVLDKPFSVGDFIIVDDAMGTVEFVGLKTTRLRSLSGEQIVFSNADLLKSRIRNYKRMEERRVAFTIGVVYRTTEAQLCAIPQIVREAIEMHPQVRFDRTHFKAFGQSSLDFEVVYYIADPDYNLYMDIQQAINLTLLRRFAHENIEFAYPSQTVYLATSGAGE
ncbi:MAG TPA: mechanosensitive ion channel family protein [Paucimonas sp.]|nr:mechanosensitive ion channel family protein [Paucimonas sp.]